MNNLGLFLLIVGSIIIALVYPIIIPIVMIMIGWVFFTTRD